MAGESLPEAVAVTRLKAALSCATCALLGVTSVSKAEAQARDIDVGWDIDIGLLTYTEQDRNTGLEFLLKADRTLADDDVVSIGVEIDTLTGATPNGATPSNVPQTFTQSSGDGSYIVAANTLPADDTHMDTRLAVDAGYLNQYNDGLGIGAEGSLSMEFDYLSFGLGNYYNWALNQNNSTVSFSLSGQYDMVHPVGNVPDALALMTPEDTPQNRSRASVSRSSIDSGLALSQVLDPRSLLQLRYTRSASNGYLTDPYKLVSIINDGFGNPGSTLEYRFERRPNKRDSDALHIAYKRQTGPGILDLSYRYISDSWSIESSTVEFRYRYPLSGTAYIQPKLRYYRQTTANFFRHSLPATEALPEYVSADTRLAAFDAVTLGLTYGKGPTQDKGFRIIGEYYWQDGESYPADAIGLQKQQNLFPTFRAFVVKLVYSTTW